MNETIILELADRLGVTIEYIGKQVISHQQFSGIYTIISIMVFLIIGYYIVRYLNDNIRACDQGDKFMAMFLVVLIYCTLFLIISTIIHGALLSVFFPEYTGIKEMISMVRR